ncbi:hypothetical protein UZ36_07090 [Candidatus Nitromaritima sp. SCGC AAA799-C22]|nr:hypothetical protein UZ36_07090 [Candidatus Nitromaritima sp. SCGC AAA799-C22]
MKQLAKFAFFLGLFALTACDKELKEHPISPQLKRQLAAQEQAADPGKTISGTIEIAAALVSKIPEKKTLFIVARPEGVSGGPPPGRQTA